MKMTTFAFVGMLFLMVLLGQHSRMLMRDRDEARNQVASMTTERDKARAEAEAARAHEAELQAALVAGEQKARDLQRQYDTDTQGIANAKPNDCTDAPVAADIDSILRDETARQNLGYLPHPAKRADSTRNPEVERRHQSGYGAILLASAARCASL